MTARKIDQKLAATNDLFNDQFGKVMAEHSYSDKERLEFASNINKELVKLEGIKKTSQVSETKFAWLVDICFLVPNNSGPKTILLEYMASRNNKEDADNIMLIKNRWKQLSEDKKEDEAKTEFHQIILTDAFGDEIKAIRQKYAQHKTMRRFTTATLAKKSGMGIRIAFAPGETLEERSALWRERALNQNKSLRQKNSQLLLQEMHAQRDTLDEFVKAEVMFDAAYLSCDDQILADHSMSLLHEIKENLENDQREKLMKQLEQTISGVSGTTAYRKVASKALEELAAMPKREVHELVA